MTKGKSLFDGKYYKLILQINIKSHWNINPTFKSNHSSPSTLQLSLIFLPAKVSRNLTDFSAVRELQLNTDI